MPAGTYDTVIEQGTNWSLILTLKKPNKLPVDLTGYSVKSTIRKTHTSTEILATPSAEVMSPACSGRILLKLDHTVTSELSFDSGVYDVVVKAPTGQLVRLLQGKVRFSPSVTEWYPPVVNP